ncbi:MAG: riboflavin kinase [Thermoprotei archaeon]|nr:MAG: riboflavin kinase [Thermoprotei archaeon]RLF17909.1 MAG: riboflavin kinase [Thermoprotei archaeon]
MNIAPELWDSLYRLAVLGATKHPVAINSAAFGKALGISQQTASRRLIELEKQGLVKREVLRRGQTVMLTEKGVEALKEVYAELKRLFEEEVGELTVEGEIFTGLGEGAYYVSREGYRRQFIAKLGFDPYPGTLNVKLSDTKSLRARETLEHFRGIEIEGFSDGDRTYGPVKCFRATINGTVEGAIVIARRTHYGKDTLEFIAPINVRRALSLKDGDRIKAEIRLVH